jgi:hypothetical protein
MKDPILFAFYTFFLPITIIYLIFILFYQWVYKYVIVETGKNHFIEAKEGQLFLINGLFIFGLINYYSDSYGVWFYISGIIVAILILIKILFSIFYDHLKEYISGVVIAIFILFSIHLHIFSFFHIMNGADGGNFVFIEDDDLWISVILSMIGFNIAFFLKKYEINIDVIPYVMKAKPLTLQQKLKEQQLKESLKESGLRPSEDINTSLEKTISDQKRKERAEKIAKRLEDRADEISNQKPLTEEEIKKGWEEHFKNKENEE